MKKKNIAFIMFGLAASNILTIPIFFPIFQQLWIRLEMPYTAMRISLAAIVVAGIIAGIFFICLGIIIYLKFRKD